MTTVCMYHQNISKDEMLQDLKHPFKMSVLNIYFFTKSVCV